MDGAEVPLGTEVVEISKRGFVRQVVHTVEDVEELAAELQLPALRERETLQERHVPIVEAGEAKLSLADIAKDGSAKRPGSCK